MKKISSILLCIFSIGASNIYAADFYVSSTKGANDNDGSKASPFAEIDKALMKAKSGDTVHVSAGKYYGSGKTAFSETKEAISIIGGYNDTFSSRDFKKNMTILTGDNKSMALNSAQPRLRILPKSGNVSVDGLVFDISERNAYLDGKVVVRKANPKTGSNASLDTPTMEIGTAGGKINITNCLLLNNTHTGIRVKAGKDADVNIKNNWVINNAGLGLELTSTHHSATGAPKYSVSNNTILFTWKYDGYGSRGGEGISMDGVPIVSLSNNIIAFSDNYAIVNGRGNKNLTVTDNIILNSGKADYWEGNLYLSVKEMSDAKLISSAKNNSSKNLTFKVDPSWANLYASRVLIDRNKVEADIQAGDTKANQLRSILGLPQQAGAIKTDANVHAHPMPLTNVFLVAPEAGNAGAK